MYTIAANILLVNGMTSKEKVEEEVQVHNEKHSLLTTQSLTSLHFCTIALHVDIHLVCCSQVVSSWDGDGLCSSRTAGGFVFVSTT